MNAPLKDSSQSRNAALRSSETLDLKFASRTNRKARLSKRCASRTPIIDEIKFAQTSEDETPLVRAHL